MKIPFVDSNLLSKVMDNPEIQTINTTNEISDDSVIQTNSRSSTIIPAFVGKIITVYNGKRSIRVSIKPEMVGFKLGSFCLTKKLGISIHNSEHNRKKIAKMKRKITQKKIRKTPTAKTKTKKTVKRK